MDGDGRQKTILPQQIQQCPTRYKMTQDPLVESSMHLSVPKMVTPVWPPQAPERCLNMGVDDDFRIVRTEHSNVARPCGTCHRPIMSRGVRQRGRSEYSHTHWSGRREQTTRGDRMRRVEL